MMVRNDGYFRRERRWRGAGVAIPIFSLRTPSSLGCGEFLDLLPLIDWCSAIGLHLIQVLPVSDTSVRGTNRDSYPYSSLCVFALHPMYLNLEALVEGGLLPDGIEKEISEARLRLDLPDVDYVGTIEVKMRLSRKVFDAVGKQTVESRGFKEFYARNMEWLR
jgi:4-alpha-glucanotransferase